MDNSRAGYSAIWNETWKEAYNIKESRRMENGKRPG